MVRPAGPDPSPLTAVRPRAGLLGREIAAVPRPLLLAAAAVVVAVWAVAVVLRVLHPAAGGLDLAWNGIVSASTAPSLLAVAEALNTIGAGLPAVLVTVLVAIGVALLRGPFWGAFVVAAASISDLQTALLKLTAARPRPSTRFTVDTSFPSGHTTNAALITVVLALLVRRAVVWVLACGWIVAMAWSRTQLHAHWVSDVAAGAALGAATALLLLAAAQALRRHLLRRSRERRATA